MTAVDQRDHATTEQQAATDETPFDVGDRVIYPHHGIGTVTEITDRDVMGETTDYLCVDLDTDLVVWLPCATSAELGLRPPASKADARQALDLLTDHDIDIPRSFRPRHKRNERRLRSGELDEVAMVVRELTIRSSRRRLSPTECRQLLHARRILEGELCAALGKDEDAVARMVDKRLPEPIDPAEAA